MTQSPSTRDAIPGLADRVRILRAAREWSQGELARRAGTSPDSISKIEREHRFPSLRLARDIARALEVSIDELLPESERPKKNFGKISE